ncbi:MAG: redox-sensing transcriptional repressor Rex [bacterium]
MAAKKKHKFPKTTVERLSYYFRTLEGLAKRGIDTVSSEVLGSKLNIKSSQIRKDLSYFGDFGKRGMGYDVKYLLKELRYILGLDRRWSVIVVGMGNLGTAIAQYPGLEKRGFQVVGFFDNSRTKIGQEVNGIPIRSMDELPDFVKENTVEIALITVPAASAQPVCNKLCKAGIKAILNFAPTPLTVDENVKHLSVDLTTKLEVLTYYMSFSKDKLWKIFA